MKPEKPTVPPEAIEAYNEYIHGRIDRRSFLDRVMKVSASAAAASALVEALMPNYAAAQQVRPDDPRLKTETVTIPSPQGNGTIKGYLARPATAGGANGPGAGRHGPVLRLPAAAGRRAEDQSRGPGAPRRARHAPGRRLARL